MSDRLDALRSLWLLTRAVRAAGVPRRVEIAQRVAAFPADALPVGAEVTIRWSSQLVPFIEAARDRDAAVALGAVHAHLRWTQIELMRHAAHGRLAELLGPGAVAVDHALRALEPTRAVPAIAASLPQATRLWVQGFVDGINHWIRKLHTPPFDARVLALGAAPWTIEDVLALGRIAAADAHWIPYLSLLKLAARSDWPDLWRQLKRAGTGVPALDEDPSHALAQIADLVARARTGSNAVAIGAARGEGGSAWLAGDPHLPITSPNIWLAATLRAPSYRVAGLMIPGLPMVAIGRNERIAWGGTNLHAASSDLFDARSVEPQTMVQRTATLRVRGGRPRTVRWRDSPLGPVISDVPALHARGAPAALRWVGHTQSDELSAMLALNGATDWASFCAATARIAVPGQNWVYADRDGHVGLRRAAMLPRRPRDWPRNLLLPPDEIASWRTLADADELPSSFDPPDALIVSANEAPPDGTVPVGFLFSPEHRARRMRHLLAAAPRIGFEQLRRLQFDTMAVAARTTAHALAHELNARQAALRDALLAWDGRYDAASRGALAYELLVDALARLLHRKGGLIASRASWDVEALLRDDLAALPSHARAALLDRAARIAARKLRRHRVWGDLHRLQPQHPLASLPVVGRAFRGPRWPADGSRETLHNSAHGFTSRPHVARFGSMARYIFDLGDLDRSWIVLLGGNDGWFGSAAAMDQVPAWRAGTLVQLPLTAEAAAQSYPHVTRVRPA